MQKRLTEQGLRFLEEGQFEKAGHILSLLIAHFPENAEAHHMLGIIELEKGNYDQAYRLVNTAIDLDPKNSLFCNTMGNIELHRAKISNAEQAFQNAVKYNTEKIEYQYNLANFYLTQNQFSNAIDHFYLILQNNPTHYLSIRGITVSYLYSGEIEIALEHATEWVLEYSEYDEPYYYLGLCQYALNDISGALTSYDKGLSIVPTNHEIMSAIGACYRSLGNRSIAETYIHNALGIEPRNPVAVYNLGCLHLDNGDLDSAQNLFKNAMSLDPGYAEPLCGLGNIDLIRGNDVAALQHFAAAKEHEPFNAQAQQLYATTLLRRQQFAVGWEAFKNTLTASAAIKQIPTWDGQQLHEELLLVWIPKETMELTLQILFASILPELLKIAPQVILMVDPILVPIFERCFSNVQVCSSLEVHSIGRSDISFQIPISALGCFFRNSLQDFNTRTPKYFLKPDPSRVQYYKTKYQSLFPNKKTIGIAWKGNKSNKSTDYANTTQLNAWNNLLEQEQYQFISLQIGDCASEIKVNTATQQDRIYIENEIRLQDQIDILELSAMLAALDVIVSMDNIISHLAGALGLQTITLLPVQAAWYWFTATTAAPWYENVRLVRQKEINQWAEVFVEVESLIAKTQ